MQQCDLKNAADSCVKSLYLFRNETADGFASHILMGPCLLPLNWIFLVGLTPSQITPPPTPRSRHLTLMGTPSVDLRAHVGVAFVSYFYHHFFNQGQPRRSLTVVSQIQKEKLYGFHSHQSESSQEMYPPGGALVRLERFFPLGCDKDSWKVQPTATLSSLNSLFLGLAPIVSPSNFILTLGS